MNCTRCHGSDIDSSGICLTCGHDVSDWKKKLDQRLQAMSQKEEEIKQNLHNIIDAAVSRQTDYSPSQDPGGSHFIPAREEAFFPDAEGVSIKEKTEPVAGLFFNTGNDTHDASDAEDLSYTAILDVINTIDDESIVYEDDAAGEGHVWDVNDIAINDVDITNNVDVADDEDVVDDEDIPNSDEITPNMVPDEQRSYFHSQSEIRNPKSEIRPAGGAPYLLNGSNPEGRLIFLSRTLSGLIDLFLIAIFTGIFLCAADFFTDVPMMSSITAASFSVLFLMIYFLYSIFFIGTNGQTIGMVMTDLRVTGMNEKQPLLSQVVHRNAVFLVSLFGLGIGLLAGIISRDYLCLHDRSSKTRVIRAFEETED